MERRTTERVPMMRCWIVAVSLLLIPSCLHAAAAGDNSEGRRRLVCYYANWAIYRPSLAKFTPENIDPHLCTHLIYAFAGMNKDYELKPFDSYNDLQLGNYKKFTNLKTYNPKLKLLIAVGGWNEGSKRFSKMVESASSRLRFVRGAVSFLRKHGFDGLDLDWEYPGSRDGGRDSDKEGYTKLVQELREAFDSDGKSRLLLTMAVPAGKQYIDKGYDIKELSKHLDFLNLLSYDYHTSQEAEVNHHAPLREEPGLEDWNPNKQLNVEWTVRYYLDRGCPASKLVLGVPTYGRSFSLADPRHTEIGAPAAGPGEKGDSTREAGYLAYYEICQLIQEQEWELEAPYPSLMGPYAYKDNQWVGFDDEDIILEKVKFIVRHGLGGGMVWTLDNDDFRGRCYGERSPLIATLKSALQQGDALLEATTTSTAAPAKRRQKVAKASTSAPPPFTTPDPGPAFECEDEGFFNHPSDCKKYFWCLDSGPSNLGLVAHAFTCPSGLHFNKRRDSCDYAANVACKIKKVAATTTSTTRRPRPKPRTRKTTTRTTTTTTTTTTEAPPPEPKGNDPELTVNGQSLAELLNLLQQLGVNQIHDKLHGRESRDSNATVRTTPQYSAPDRGRATQAPQTELFVQYASPARKKQKGGEEPEEAPVQARGPQYHVPAPEAPEVSHVDLTEDAEAPPPSSGGDFPFVYHTPSRRRTESTSAPAEEEKEEPYDDDVTTTTAKPGQRRRQPQHRRVVVKLRPIPGEAVPREATTPADGRNNNYVLAQTVGVRRQVRPVNVFDEEEEEEEESEVVTTPPPPRRRARPRTTTTDRPRFGRTSPPPRKELIVLPSGKPAVPATTRRYRTHSAPFDHPTRGPGLALLSDGGVTCLRRGVHPHPKDCAKFIVCVPASSEGGEEELDGFIHECPPGTRFADSKGRCSPAVGEDCGRPAP